MLYIEKTKIAIFSIIFFGIVNAEKTNPCISDHKQSFIETLNSDPSRFLNDSYPYERVLKAIQATDTDGIPKVHEAGKVFQQDGINFQLMHNGIKVVQDGYYGSWMTDIIYALQGHHEPQEEKAFFEVLKYIKPGSVMIELGAYWGYYSLWFNKNIKNAVNWLIEPELDNLQLGMKNFQLNNLKANFLLGYVQSSPYDSQYFKNAKNIKIDKFMIENNIKHIHLLHSDIQGAEYVMLLSSAQALRNKKIDYLFISTHTPEIHEACKNFLVKMNYLILCDHSMEESCSHDGLVVARRKDIIGPSYIEINKYN